jgi:hypothetical protein
MGGTENQLVQRESSRSAHSLRVKDLLSLLGRSGPVTATGGVTQAARKVVCVGLDKTGTTSLRRCFELLGYRCAGYDHHALESMASGCMQPVFQRMDAFEAFADTPWFMLYEQFSTQYPDCRFILTTRSDASRWAKSALSHDRRHNLPGTIQASARQIFLDLYRGLGADLSDPAALYDFHNRRVRHFFSSQADRLLTVCWETGDGWPQLCRFLGKPVPRRTPFPHENVAPAMD